jgi:hypothetical protein
MKKLITENPLNRIKLMMNYELGKTLNENLKESNLLTESELTDGQMQDAVEEIGADLDGWVAQYNLESIKKILLRLKGNTYDGKDAILALIELYEAQEEWGDLETDVENVGVKTFIVPGTKLKKEILAIIKSAKDNPVKPGQKQNTGGDGGKQTSDGSGFPKCAQLKGKVVNGTITYQSVVWDKPSVSLSPNGTYMVNSGKYKGKIGKYSCTQGGKVYLELPGASKSDGGDGGKVKTGGSKKTYYDCSSVNLDTAALTYGCKDERIAKVQGCLGIAADGKFGPNTRKALVDNAYDISNGITKAVYEKVLAGCGKGLAQSAGSTDGSLADVNYLRNPIKMDLGKVPEMPNKNSQGMSDAKYYQSLVAGGLIQKNLAGRIAYNGPVLEPEEKIKLDNQALVLGYVPTAKDSATDEGARYVWKRK